MEVLHQFGTPEQKDRWLTPLLDGEIRSAFAMTEPTVASSDATNIELRIETRRRVRAQRPQMVDDQRAPPEPADPDRDGQDEPAGAHLPAAVDGAGALRHARSHGPRNLSVFGYDDHQGHGEVEFSDVRVPAENIIAGEGMGFMIAQARLGPGRIHHCIARSGSPSGRSN